MSNSLKFDHEEKEGNEDLMSAALFVEAAEDEDDGRPPQDGMAYLRQVIKERKRVPDTVTAEVSQKKKPKMTRVETEKSGDNSKRNDRVKVPPPPGTCPGSTWQREQMAQFSEVRLKTGRHAELGRRSGEVGVGSVKVPDKRNEAVWCHMMLGGQVWRQVCEDREDEEEGSKAKTDVEADLPKLDFMLSVPVHVWEHVLEYLITWLQVTGWRPEYGPWLYSILVRLEKPLTPDVGSLLRDLVLTCSRERHRISTSGSGDANDENIAALNLFICLVAKYFGQGDLEDRDEDE